MDTGPVVEVSVIAVVIVRVVVVLPHVVLRIEVVLIDVVVHLHVCKHVPELWVVVVGDRCEWVEQIWVHLGRLGQAFPLLLLLPLFPSCQVGLHRSEVKHSNQGVEHQVGCVRHASQG